MATYFLRTLAMILMVMALPASANDHGGGGAPAPIPFILNLDSPGNGSRYLQMELMLESADPHVMGQVSAFKPKIQNEIILMVSGANVDRLRSLEGKKDLAMRIRRVVNKILGESDKTGISEVLFTTFIIQ